MNRVDCINKTDRQSAWERIHRLGGTRDDNGQRWSCSQSECIGYIEGGVQFYVERPPGHRVYLIVATSPFGNKYVKTTADGEQPDNLLSLPECS
jgi:hypothetical protein